MIWFYVKIILSKIHYCAVKLQDYILRLHIIEVKFMDEFNNQTQEKITNIFKDYYGICISNNILNLKLNYFLYQCVCPPTIFLFLLK